MFGAAGRIANAASGGSETLTVTEGSQFGLYFGFQGVDLPFGSVNPTSVNNSTVTSAHFYDSPQRYFEFGVEDDVAQDFLESVQPDGIGSPFLTSAADQYLPKGAGTQTRWRWNVGSTPAQWDGSGTSDVVVVW